MKAVLEEGASSSTTLSGAKTIEVPTPFETRYASSRERKKLFSCFMSKFVRGYSNHEPGIEFR